LNGVDRFCSERMSFFSPAMLPAISVSIAVSRPSLTLQIPKFPSAEAALPVALFLLMCPAPIGNVHMT
jgi:hypothetical protein